MSHLSDSLQNLSKKATEKKVMEYKVKVIY